MRDRALVPWLAVVAAVAVGEVDPYEGSVPYDAGLRNVATRFISRTGGVYVSRTDYAELWEAYPLTSV